MYKDLHRNKFMYCTCTVVAHTHTHTHTHTYTNTHPYLNKNIHTESKTMRDELRQPLRIGDCETEVPDTLDGRRAGTTTDGEEGSLSAALRASKLS